MIENAVVYIQDIISAYGVWGVFAATMIEEVVAPIPSSLVPLAAGFFLLPPDASFLVVAFQAIFLVALPVTVGITLTSLILYALAYYGGKPLIEKNRRWLGVSWRDVERIEARMTKGRKDEITLFILRLVPIIPGFALSAFCGVVRYPVARFTVITFIASWVRATILALLGWQAGEYYLRYLEVIERFEKQIFVATIVVLVILSVLYVLWVRKRN